MLSLLASSGRKIVGKIEEDAMAFRDIVISVSFHMRLSVLMWMQYIRDQRSTFYPLFCTWINFISNFNILLLVCCTLRMSSKRRHPIRYIRMHADINEVTYKKEKIWLKTYPDWHLGFIQDWLWIEKEKNVYLD